MKREICLRMFSRGSLKTINDFRPKLSKSIPVFRPNTSKTILFGAAPTYMAYIGIGYPLGMKDMLGSRNMVSMESWMI